MNPFLTHLAHRPLVALSLATACVAGLAPVALNANPAHAAKGKSGAKSVAKAPGNGPSRVSSPMPPRAYSPVAINSPNGAMAVALGRGQLVNLPGAMKDVFVADDKVADVQVKSNNQLYVYGRSAGETTIYASNAAGQVIWSTNVRVASNIDSVDQMLKVAMPESRINVATLSAGTYLLTGTVGAPEDAAEAQRLVTAYLGKEANIITRLKTATPLQVNLQVRIAEVSRSLTKTLGVNLTTIANAGSGFQFGIAQGRAAATTYVPGAPMGVGGTTTYTDSTGATKDGTSVAALSTATTLAGAGTLLGLNILGALDAGEQIGLVTTLAQPNMTALSGETGEFLAGGEFPIPISSGLGTVSIEYKKYGVSLSFTPTVLSDGRISMRVRPEVSELSSQGAVTLNGYTIPALSTRRTETSVELGSGQSMMIGGLLQNKASNTIQKMPGAGDLPVLGALFKSTSFIKGETELVIVITPYLVKPVNDGDIKLPTDGMQTANDIQQVAANMMSEGKKGVDRAKPTLKPSEGQTAPATPKISSAPDTKAGKRAVATETGQPGFSLN